jgi:hypothetical protein
MGVAPSLMLDFRCVIVPRFVYAVPGDFNAQGLASEKIIERIHAGAHTTAELAALRGQESG